MASSQTSPHAAPSILKTVAADATHDLKKILAERRGTLVNATILDRDRITDEAARYRTIMKSLTEERNATLDAYAESAKVTADATGH